MKTIGIIGEYNPFHNGHSFQLTYAREKLKADYIVVAMSGDFVQRGEPALVSKWLRTQMALQAGADLVLELPVSHATSSAEAFASGGIALLDSLGVVNELCFGVESKEPESRKALIRLGRWLADETPAYQDSLKAWLREGLSFPAARMKAATAVLSSESASSSSLENENRQLFTEEQIQVFLSQPNNILGVEYCKALARQNSSLQPSPMPREGGSYHETELPSENREGTAFASSSAIRSFLLRSISEGSKEKQRSRRGEETFSSKQAQAAASPVESHLPGILPVECDTVLARYMPADAAALLSKAWEQRAWLEKKDLDQLLYYRLLQETRPSLSEYADVSDDLAARILLGLDHYEGFSAFTDYIKTKELTYSRINRALLHIVLGIRGEPGPVSYARILGFRRNSTRLLRAIKENSRLPLVSKPSASIILREDTCSLFASDLYEKLLALKSQDYIFLNDLAHTPVII